MYFGCDETWRQKPHPCDCPVAGGSNQISEECGNVIYKAGGKCNPRAGNQYFAIAWQLGEAIKIQRNAAM